MKKFFCVFFGFLLNAYIIAAQEIKTVAVYVAGEDSISRTVKQIVGSQFVTCIVNTKGYSAIERTSDFLKELHNEHYYQHSRFVDDEHSFN